MSFKLSLFLFLLIVAAESSAQDIFKTHLGWVDGTVWYRLSEKIKVGGDIGYRTTFDDFTFHQVYVRPTVQWRVSPLLSLSFAASNFYSNIDNQINLNELRFAQQATVRWPKLGPIKLIHRVRFEERFFS